MKTPKAYTDNLKAGIVTDEMMQDVLYSYSKRAKNYRDRIRQYRDKARWNRYWYDKYGDIDKCEHKRDEYYMKKSDLLRCRPERLTAIHRLTVYRKRRVYDYNSEWDKLQNERAKYERGEESRVVWMNGYWDRDTNDYVDFCDVQVKQYRYFLYYEFPGRSFHSPIEESELKQYRDLERINLDELTTYGEDVTELLSVPFCDKVWQQITGKGAADIEAWSEQRKEEKQREMDELMAEAMRESKHQLEQDPELKAELEGKALPW